MVYDSDISINYGSLNGSLKGKNLGTVAFEVVSVTRRSGSSSSLPQVRVRILDASRYGEGVSRLHSSAPAPSSSSKPMDTVP